MDEKGLYEGLLVCRRRQDIDAVSGDRQTFGDPSSLRDGDRFGPGEGLKLREPIDGEVGRVT